MEPSVSICLFGSLGKGKVNNGAGPARVALGGPAAVTEVLSAAGIPLQRVQLVMLNHRSVPGDTLVHPGDRLAVFPREYPIFADWKDHRFR